MGNNFDLRKYLKENRATRSAKPINERKQVGDLYHFTYSEHIDSIKVKGIKFTKDNSTLDKFKNKYYISTTREKNPEFAFIREYDIRITLDGDKISDKYVVYPINVERIWGAFDDYPSDVIATKEGGFAEERIISSTESYLSPRYFKEIKKIR